MVSKTCSAASSLTDGNRCRSNCCRSSRFGQGVRFGRVSRDKVTMENGSKTAGHAPMKRRIAIISGERVEITWDERTDRISASVSGRAYNLEKRESEPGKYWLGGNGL